MGEWTNFRGGLLFAIRSCNTSKTSAVTHRCKNGGVARSSSLHPGSEAKGSHTQNDRHDGEGAHDGLQCPIASRGGYHAECLEKDLMPNRQPRRIPRRVPGKGFNAQSPAEEDTTPSAWKGIFVSAGTGY